MNKYLALALIPLSSSVMAFQDHEAASKLFIGMDYSWIEPLYLSEDIELDPDVSRIFSVGYKVDESSQFIVSYQETLSYTSMSYKRSIQKWAFDNSRFVPYFSVGIGMGSDEFGGADIDVFGVQGSIGVDYRLNSYVEFTAGISLSEQSIEVDTGSTSTSLYGISNSVNFGLRIFPF